MDQKNPLSELLGAAMEKVRGMADANTIVGQPITTVDGVTLIPISRVSFGVGGGGGDYGKNNKDGFGGGAGAGVKIDPVAFLIIKDGVTHMMPVAEAPRSTLDRIVDMAPELMDKVEKYLDKKGEKEPL